MTNEQRSKLVFLQAGGTEIGILPELGGRIVWAQADGNTGNVLLADPEIWSGPSEIRPEISAFSAFKTYSGHIIWLGPQREWWVHQDLNPGRKKEAAPWPPDPWLCFGGYTIEKKEDRLVRMTGPDSPVSGVTLTKEFSINDAGVMTMRVICTNIRKEPVSWDLWFNTRLPGMAACYVPLDSQYPLRMEIQNDRIVSPMPFTTQDGWFSFLPEMPGPGITTNRAKAFIYPARGCMAGFSNDTCLLIGFERPDRGEIHPDQALVEIYNATSLNPDDQLLELEYHSPYRTLQPGGSMEASETWTLRKYTGNSDRESHLEFLSHLME
jgi:hypothetical protein